MAKRFTESDKWIKNEWFRTLPSKFKLFWLYLWDIVDFTGVYEVDIQLASFVIGLDYTQEEVEKIFKDKIHKINDKKWFIPEYLVYQYPTGLNSKNKAVASLRKKLIQLSFIDQVRTILGENYVKKEIIEADYEMLEIDEKHNNQAASKLLGSTCLALKETDKDTDKEIDIEKDTVKEKESVTETNNRELKELKSIDIKKEYPVLGELKNQLTEEQMIELLNDNSTAQIKEALEIINSTGKHITNDSVYESVKEYMTENQQLPFKKRKPEGGWFSGLLSQYSIVDLINP